MKKFFKLSVLYVCITLLTTVGTVFLAKFTSSTSNNNSTSFGASYTVEEPTAFDKMLDGIMSAQGLKIDLNAELASADAEPMPIKAHLNLDLSNGFDAIALQGNLSVEEKFSLDVTFKDKWLYLTVLGGNYKIQTDKISDVVKIVTGLINGTESEDVETVELDEVDNTEASEENSNSSLDISQIMASLQTMKDEENEFGHKLSGNLLGIDFVILTDVNYNIVEATTSEIKFDKYTITPNVAIDYVEEPEEIVVNEDDYLDFSTMDKLIYAVVNTAKLTDFHITTNLKIDMQIASIEKPISMDVPIDVQIKVVDKKPQIMAQFGPIPVIAPVNNDVPYVFGDTVSGLYCGLNRILNLYYADGYVYFYRSETVPVFASSSGRRYEKKLKITIEEFLDDPLMLLSYGFGFQDIIMNEITKATELATNRETPIDINNVLLGFDWDGTNCSIVINLKELANNPQLDSLNLTISTAEVNGKDYISSGTLEVKLPISDSFKINIATNNLALNNIGETLNWATVENFFANYTYKVDEKWQASKGKWELASSTTYTVNFNSNGGEDVTSVTGAIDTEYNLPTLQTRIVDNGITKTTYVFDGWFSSSIFEENTKVTVGKIKRGDLTLYAKWNETVETYHDFKVINELLQTNNTYHALEGTMLDFPMQFDQVVISTATKTTTYAFAGWYEDAEFNNAWLGGCVVPNRNVTIYAKWDVVNVVESKLLNIYNSGVLISSTGHEVGKAITLPEDVKIVSTTKWYKDSTYLEEISLPEIMPNEELNLHIRNLYTVTVVDATLNNKTITITGYQGEVLTLPTDYETVVLDDGTKTKQETYTFAGFDNNLTVMPNEDTTINVVWDYDVKYYYDVTFSKDNNVVSSYKSHIEFPIEKLRVLEGTTVNLSQYTPTWVYSTGKGIFTVWWHYVFEGWSTSKGGANISEITITNNTTIYANWDGVVKTGKN